MNKNKKIVIISFNVIALIASYGIYMMINYDNDEPVSNISNNILSLNQTKYLSLQIELERMQNENQKLSSIISDIIAACNKASNNEHNSNNNSLEKENEILQKALEKLRGI